MTNLETATFNIIPDEMTMHLWPNAACVMSTDEDRGGFAYLGLSHKFQGAGTGLCPCPMSLLTFIDRSSNYNYG